MLKRPNPLIYWCGYLILFAAGIAASWFRLLPVCNTAVFLFSLLWLWSGLSGLLGFNPQLKAGSRRLEVICCLALIGLGLAWLPLSMLPQSHQALPVILTAAPFLTVIAAAKFVLRKKT